MTTQLQRERGPRLTVAGPATQTYVIRLPKTSSSFMGWLAENEHTTIEAWMSKQIEDILQAILAELTDEESKALLGRINVERA